jgi:hypothetical protein
MPACERQISALPVLTTLMVAARRFSKSTILGSALANLHHTGLSFKIVSSLFRIAS